MSDLLYEVTDHVGVIILNRPDAMNSLTHQLYADLEDTVRTSEARVLVDHWQRPRVLRRRRHETNPR